jgi:outer membrane protein OmpA-like peptidoglycan-associated protein
VRLYLLIGLIWVAHLASAQQTTIINHFEGDTTSLGSDQGYVLSTSERHTVIINYYEIAGDTDEERMKWLLSDALNFYIDRSILVDSENMNLKGSPNRTLKDLDAIVADAIDYYHFKEIEDFNGFSKQISAKLNELDGKQIEKNWNAQNQKGVVINGDAGFLFVENEINELKQLVNQELSVFTMGNLMVKVSTGQELLDQAQLAKIEEAKAFKTNSLLEPMEIDFSKSTMTLLAAEDDFVLPSMEERFPKGDLADQILDLLENNNREIQSLRNEVSEVKAAQAEESEARMSAQNNQLQAQIDELRQLLTLLVEQNLNQMTGVAQERPIALPKNQPNSTKPHPRGSNKVSSFSVSFYSGSTSISLNAQLQLNELVSLMAYDTEMRIMLTGYADKVGSRDENLKLSKTRAQRIRKYLLDSGIETHRVLVNFFGEEMASGNAKGDRRVEVTFLPAN